MKVVFVLAVLGLALTSAYKTTPRPFWKGVRFPPPFYSYDEIAPAEIEVNEEFEDSSLINEDSKPGTGTKPRLSRRPNLCAPNYKCIALESKSKLSEQVKTIKAELDQILGQRKANVKPTRKSNSNSKDEKRENELRSEMQKYKEGLEVIKRGLEGIRDSKEFSCLLSKKCWKRDVDRVSELIDEATVLAQLPPNVKASVVLKNWIRRAGKEVKKFELSLKSWNALAKV